ncbi:hypothetical protein XENOCAPTIV_026481, partial [Xenoophorus captivus]
YELVKLLLSYGAEVNCYFRVISNTVFPTALQYCLRDQAMLRLLLNNGYQAHKHFVSVSWLAHLAGSVVRILLDYVSHISICFNLKRILERTPHLIHFASAPGEPRSLQHLCRLVIRGRMDIRMLNDPEAMAAVPFPPRLINYLTYSEDDLNGRL